MPAPPNAAARDTLEKSISRIPGCLVTTPSDSWERFSDIDFKIYGSLAWRIGLHSLPGDRFSFGFNSLRAVT